MAWLVVGAGVSGVAAAKLLASRGRAVIISERAPIRSDLARELEASGVTVATDDSQGPELLRRYAVTTLVPSPGIPPSHPLVTTAIASGIPVSSEIDIALDAFNGLVIAVTGTNGKSTTTKMIEHVINRSTSSRAIACGNIGLPPSSLVLDGKSADFWVIELSSYQLEYSRPLRAAGIVFTSFSPDHMARHQTEENYFQAKWRLVDINAGHALMFADDSFIAAATKFNCRWPDNQPIRIPSFERVHELVRRWAPNIRTSHDIVNAWTATKLVAEVLGASQNDGLAAMDSFAGLPHRFEILGTINGYEVINDSKATNVASTCRTLANLREPCTLLLGGQGKEESYLPLLQYSDRIKRVICFGQAGRAIKDDMDGRVTVLPYATLKDVLDCLDLSWFDGPFVLSPACASFDEFKNFEDRGEQFTKKLKTLIRDKA